MIDIGIKGDILIIANTTLKEALLTKETFEQHSKIVRPFLIYKSEVGYYSGWDCVNNRSIYCGTRSENTSITQVKEYAKTL